MDKSTEPFKNIQELLKTAIFLKQQLKVEEAKRRPNPTNNQNSSVYKRLSGMQFLYKICFNINKIEKMSLFCYQLIYKLHWTFQIWILVALFERQPHAWKIWCQHRKMDHKIRSQAAVERVATVMLLYQAKLCKDLTQHFINVAHSRNCI